MARYALGSTRPAAGGWSTRSTLTGRRSLSARFVDAAAIAAVGNAADADLEREE